MRSKKTDRFKPQPHQNVGGVKAVIFTACLIGCGWVGVATAEQHEGNPAAFQQLAMTSIVAYCDTMGATSTHTVSVQMLPEKMEDSTEQVDLKNLHACQYMRETAASGCLEQGECKSYDEWSESHPEISLKLPAGALKTALNERRQELERTE
jgi:enamine deaminase RidA (YjgF/YER057c/UK114 family)